MTTPVDTRGAIDADGHILEPPDLWEKYLEAQYRERAIRIRTYADGLEYFEYNGKPSTLMPAGFAGSLGGMGATDILPSPGRTYLRGAPFGSIDPKERITRLDQEGLSKAVLYPTLGIPWEPEVRDPEIAAAYLRAHNRWIMPTGEPVPLAIDEFRHSPGSGIRNPVPSAVLNNLATENTEAERVWRGGAELRSLHRAPAYPKLPTNSFLLGVLGG
jgi:hypothetical protein